MQRRGELTEQVQKIAEEKLGRPLKNTTELRLMPYVQYCLMNDRHLDPNKINSEDRTILADWKREGWLVGGISKGSLAVSKYFWDAMHEILWTSYVDI